MCISLAKSSAFFEHCNKLIVRAEWSCCPLSSFLSKDTCWFSESVVDVAPEFWFWNFDIVYRVIISSFWGMYIVSIVETACATSLAPYSMVRTEQPRVLIYQGPGLVTRTDICRVITGTSYFAAVRPHSLYRKLCQKYQNCTCRQTSCCLLLLAVRFGSFISFIQLRTSFILSQFLNIASD